MARFGNKPLFSPMASTPAQMLLVGVVGGIILHLLEILCHIRQHLIRPPLDLTVFIRRPAHTVPVDPAAVHMVIVDQPGIGIAEP